jgi:hypothetical protein
MKRSLIALIFFIGMCHFSSAQLSRYTFDGDMNMKMSLRYGKLQNTKIDAPDYSGIVFRFYDLGRSNYSESRKQYSGRWAFIPETFSSAVVDILFTQNFEWASRADSATLISDFLLGWHNWAYSVMRTDDFQLSIGAHAHDYFYAFQLASPQDTHEPAGWYIGTGPVVMIDYNLLNQVVLHFEGTYSFTKKIKDVPDMTFDRSYPSPHFINFLLEVRPESRWFLGLEHVRSYNRGWNPNDGARTDVHLGFKLFVDQ